MKRAIFLTPRRDSHDAELSSGVDSPQSCAAVHAEHLGAQPPEQHGHLTPSDRPTWRKVPAVVVDPSADNGAIVFDSGAFAVYPPGGVSLGRFGSHDEAQEVLLDWRASVEGIVDFLAWLAGGPR